MKRRVILLVFATAISLSAWLAACGSSPSPADATDAAATETETTDAGETEAEADTSTADVFAEADAKDAGNEDAPFVLGPPQVLSAGGAVLDHPRVVPIVFEGDARKADIEQFMQDMAASTYWHDVTAEYGVGALTFANTIVAPLSELPTTPITYAEIDAYVQAHLDSSDAGTSDSGSDAGGDGGDGGVSIWGAAADHNAIYTVFYPESVVVIDGQERSCTSFGGFHSQTYVSESPYAAIFACPHFGTLTETDMVTTSASHEWAETATNPQFYTHPAFSLPDTNHAEWALYTGVMEIGDLCVLDSTANYLAVGFHHKVQRMWSNAAALAGHNPCVPSDDTVPYFVAVPEFLDTVPIAMVDHRPTTRGLQVKLGETKTAMIDLKSDQTTGPWTVAAHDSVQLYGGVAELRITLAPVSGLSGDKLQMTITRLANGKFGGSLLYVDSYKDAMSYRYWLSFVAN